MAGHSTSYRVLSQKCCHHSRWAVSQMNYRDQASGKEFSNWKTISNKQDINIYFADPGTPYQRGLNGNSNGSLWKSGLPKGMDFNLVSQK